MAKEILFIAHDAGYTGAPIMFLNFLRWFKENTQIPFRILLRKSGPLESNYRLLAPVFTIGRGINGVLSRRFGSIFTFELLNRMEQKILHKEYSKVDIGLVYANTTTNGRVLDALNTLNCSVITHVHELENWIRDRIGEQNFYLAKAHTDHFIAVSEMVRKNLINNHAIPYEKIDLIYEFIDTSKIFHSKTPLHYSTIRRQLNIPEDAFIVGGCGTTDLRKGVDLFVSIGESIPRQVGGRPVHFVWVGGHSNLPESRQLQEALRSARINDRMHFVGEKPDPNPYFASFDVYTLTSREDPFPLVMLEAAAHAKPIVCFNGAGGALEFIGDDCGICVPYLDLKCMASKVEVLLSDENLCRWYGNNAQRKVNSQYDVSVCAPRILEVICRYLRC